MLVSIAVLSRLILMTTSVGRERGREEEGEKTTEKRKCRKKRV